MKTCKCNYQSNSCSPQPSVIVTQNTEGVKGLANAFVHVIGTNSTYFINGCHEITEISQGLVFEDGYDADANKLGIRKGYVADFENNKLYLYNARGEYRTIKLEED